MRLQQVFCGLVCDERGCEAMAGDGEHEWWGDVEEALEVARDADWDVVDATEPVYCPSHRRLRCDLCDERDEDMRGDYDGWLTCTRCAATDDENTPTTGRKP